MIFGVNADQKTPRKIGITLIVDNLTVFQRRMSIKDLLWPASPFNMPMVYTFGGNNADVRWVHPFPEYDVFIHNVCLNFDLEFKVENLELSASYAGILKSKNTFQRYDQLYGVHDGRVCGDGVLQDIIWICDFYDR